MATAPPKTGTGTAPAKPPPLGRLVVWIGLAAGTAITVLAVLHGIRIPGLQVVLSVLVTWLLLMVLAVTVAELARRHHRAAARHAWRHSRRGASWLGAYLAGKAAGRWQRRPHRPLMFTRPPPATDPEPPPPYVTAAAPPPAPAAPGGGTPPPPERTSTMTDTKIVDDDDSTAGRPRTRRPTGGSHSAAWKAVVAETSDFEPEDDGHLLAWMAAEVNGMSAYAEAMTEVYETCVNSVGLDPVAMKATHDVADAAADAATAMAAARVKFASHYGEVREFAASGGVLPHDGRWITGDGEA
jgi:hypothetical protein